MKDLKYTYFLILILIMSFVLNPFAKKKATMNLGSDEFFMINHFICTIIVIIYFIYLVYYSKCNLKSIKEMNKNEIFWCTMSALLGVIGSLVLINLVRMDEITFIMPNVQPIVLLIGAFIGYFLFQESMGLYKIIGIFLIILGAFSINYEKIIKS